MSMPPIELKDYTVKEISLKVNEEYDPREHKESPNDEGFQFMHLVLISIGVMFLMFVAYNYTCGGGGT